MAVKDLPALGKFLLGEGAEDTPGWLQVIAFTKIFYLSAKSSSSRQFTAPPLHWVTSWPLALSRDWCCLLPGILLADVNWCQCSR